MPANLSLTVTQLNSYIQQLVRSDPLLRNLEVRGEVSNVKLTTTGLLFFTLKDEQSVIQCTMFEEEVQTLPMIPYEGMHAVVEAYLGVYIKSGQYRLTVKRLKMQGIGPLYERFQALKEKLEREGLFAESKKIPIPKNARTLGIVTSPTGAAVRDIIQISCRRNPGIQILIAPVQVQGIHAAEEVADGIRLLDSVDEVDTVIVARGGGSIEDLWAFNEEAVVRAVAGCHKPIISAVGHETDITLCDLAADFRAPTPSAAAECAVTALAEQLAEIQRIKDVIRFQMKRRCDEQRNIVDSLRMRMVSFHPKSIVDHHLQNVQLQKQALRTAINHVYLDALHREELCRQRLELCNPALPLKKGFAYIKREGISVFSAKQLQAEDKVSIHFSDGTVHATVQ